jgi:Spy/CpxP family protein refolding chaperone
MKERERPVPEKEWVKVICITKEDEMTSTRKVSTLGIIFAICVLCLCLAPAAFAEPDTRDICAHQQEWRGQGHHHMRMPEGMISRDGVSRGWFNSHFLDKLDLTDAQKTAIKGIRNSTRKNMVQKRADLRIAELELRELMDSESVDITAVESQIKKIEANKSAMLLTRIKSREAMRSQLTPDQRAKLSELMRNKKGFRCPMDE